jgi:hypothetical protein
MTTLMLQVKELLSRNLDAVEIAHRLHANLDQVTQAIDLLNQIL